MNTSTAQVAPSSNTPALLANDNPTYLRRLARELSHRPAGFYHGGQRWNYAAFSKGALRIGRTIGHTPRGCPNRTFLVFGSVSQTEGPFFDDGQGNNIYASRQP